ncbi:MAG TPA: lamin tail domain-containing protein [Candidatus Saccharimonadales bacterium]|nr:lamin tail domain-containing protein [Candidatus Saccharimonadales bacterium]
MPRVKTYLRVGFITAASLVLGVFQLHSLAATTTLTLAATPSIFITEIQTSNASAGEEFVKLYNATDQDIDFADALNQGQNVWKLQFYSSTTVANGNPDWTKPSASLTLTGVIAAHDYYLLSSAQTQNGASIVYRPGSIDPDQTYSPRLADSGGGLQLVDVSSSRTESHDRVMWHQPVAGQSLPSGVLPSPAPSSSLQRLTNEDGEYIERDGQLTNFAVESQISPKDTWTPPTPTDSNTNDPSENSSDTGSSDSTSDSPNDNTVPETEPVETVNNLNLSPPEITELLPNPASPASDGMDEYVEVYNPNNTDFNLKGYTLETGTSTLHDFTFTSDTILPAGSYTAFYSKDTHLSLTNSGSQTRLLDPIGQTLNQTDIYPNAPDGQTWALNNEKWQWTTTPTPNAANLITTPAVAAISNKTTSNIKTASKKTTKTSKSKVLGANTTKPKKPKSSKTALPATNLAANPAALQTPIHPWTLALVALLALLYGAYEYRHDLKNRYLQFRRNRAASRADRP